MWQGNRRDGRVLADYATALALGGRTQDAEQVFEEGLKVCTYSRGGRIAVLEEYAKYLDQRGRFPKAHEKYRELIRLQAYSLHVYRRFSRSLMLAAATARADGDVGREDACIGDTVRHLKKLLEIAPEDTWAAELLHRVEQRIYAE
jgi:tetratricopeptide (TPR) repeat protein